MARERERDFNVNGWAKEKILIAKEERERKNCDQELWNEDCERKDKEQEMDCMFVCLRAARFFF